MPLLQLNRHLLWIHLVPKSVHCLLLEYCNILDVIKADVKIVVCPENVPVIPALLLYYDRYSCSRCYYLTINYREIMKHLNTAHSIYRSACKDHFTHVPL